MGPRWHFRRPPGGHLRGKFVKPGLLAARDRRHFFASPLTRKWVACSISDRQAVSRKSQIIANMSRRLSIVLGAY